MYQCRATKLCTVAPNVFGSSVRNWLRVIFLVLTILRWLPDISKNCGPLPSGIFLQALCTSHPPTSDQSAEYRSNAVFPSHLLPSASWFELSSSAFFSVCSFLTVKDQIQESHKTTYRQCLKTSEILVTSQRLWQATKMNLYRPITKKRTKCNYLILKDEAMYSTWRSLRGEE